MDNANFAIVVIITCITIVFLLIWVILVVPQRRARHNQLQVLDDLRVGEEIVTVGGIIGKLTFLDRDKDMARMEIAKGIEVRLIPSAISHPLDYMDRVRALEARATAKSK